jgi:hypothetical protein
MTPEQKDLYDSIKEGLVDTIEVDGRELSVSDARAKFTRLRQAGEGLFTFSKLSVADLQPPYYSGKLKWIYNFFKEMIEAGPENKVILWSAFTKMPEMVHYLFPDHSVLHTGSMTANAKRLSRWAFQGCVDAVEEKRFAELAAKTKFKFAPGGAQFFCATIDSRASAGMNLQSCWCQVFSSLPTSSIAWKQAAGRIRRRDQRSEIVHTLCLESKGTWERGLINYMTTLTVEGDDLIYGKERMTRDMFQELFQILKRGG